MEQRTEPQDRERDRKHLVSAIAGYRRQISQAQRDCLPIDLQMILYRKLDGCLDRLERLKEGS